MTLQIFIAEHCSPCQDLKAAVEAGKFGTDVEIIDVESEEGFPYIEKLGLTEVPSAFFKGKKCLVHYKDDGLQLECPDDSQEATTNESSG